MAKSVKVRGRFTVPGQGADSNGVPQQDKTIVIGELDITSYTALGEPLSAADLGLETIDAVMFDVRTVNNAATVPASGAIPMAAYDQTGARVIVNIDHGADTAVTTGEAASLNFVAFGNSALQATLT